MKDNIATNHGYTTAASKILSNYESPFNATIIDLLSSNGSKLIGKSNLDEFGMGSANYNSYFNKVTNPYDNTKVPGGSSGGSAASVAGKCVHSALELILEDQCGCLQVIVTYLDSNLLMVEFLDGGYTVCTDIGYSGDYR